MSNGNYARTSHKPYEGEMYTDEQEAAPRNLLALLNEIWEDKGSYCALLDALDHLALMQNSHGNIVTNDTICAIEAAQSEHTPECAWRQDDFDNGTWETACGEYYVLIEGKPKENDMNFCHGCGKPILEVVPA